MIYKDLKNSESGTVGKSNSTKFLTLSKNLVNFLIIFSLVNITSAKRQFKERETNAPESLTRKARAKTVNLKKVNLTQDGNATTHNRITLSARPAGDVPSNIVRYSNIWRGCWGLLRQIVRDPARRLASYGE
jgi:hypothetical protein